MGQAKKEQMEREEDSARRWQTKCQIEGWKCSRCEAVPPFEEREIFFRDGQGPVWLPRAHHEQGRPGIRFSKVWRGEKRVPF